jgi:hypothetical protein
MPAKKIGVLLIACLCCCATTHAQETGGDGRSADTDVDKVLNLPSRFFRHIQDKTAKLDKQLTLQTEKYLQRMARQEARVEKKLYKLDSASAKRLFAGDPQQRYAALLKKLKTDTAATRVAMSGAYIPYADSLQGTMAFLNKNPQLLGKDPSPELQARLQSSLGQVRQLETRMQHADEIKQFLQQRKEQIRQCLSRYTHLPSGLTGVYNDYNKQLYYYGQQVNEYKQMLNDPDKMFRTALTLLNRVPAFAGFMRSNSFLSGLAGMPGNTPAVPGQAVQGLPGRGQVMNMLQDRFGGGGPNAQALTQRNIQSAQGQLDQLRDKANAKGNGSDLDMPDFKPNEQKTKTFFQRLEYGTNLQSTHGSYYFPTTTDLGMSVGYKLGKENVVGLGASYKVGWGNDISHVNVSSQGAGLRSFLDIHLKKTFFASGGFEYNYQQPFYDLSTVKSLSSWQQSGLIGVSKILSMKTKVFKKTKIQLLWDFLSYEQVPRTQPLKFRIGYNF